MRTTVVLFTRDLRVTDNVALAEAAGDGRTRRPPLRLRPWLLASRFARPNRLRFLLDALADLRASLRARSGDLVVRSGDPADRRRGPRTDDTGGHDPARRRRLRPPPVRDSAASRRRPQPPRLQVGVRAGPDRGARRRPSPARGRSLPGLQPYWRVWRQAPWRPVVAAPDRVVLPPASTPETARPARASRAAPVATPPAGGETAGRAVRSLDRSPPRHLRT